MKISPVYHCCQCKKIIEDLEDLYFIEEESPRGFCSENCIEEYFTPLINHYEAIEKSNRESLNLSKENALKHIGVPKYMEAVIARPKEIWRSTNGLDENLYSYICEFIDESKEKFYMVILCCIYNYRPSFIFLATATSNEEYLNYFRLGEKLEDVGSFLESANEANIEYNYDEELVNELEQLKSTILAELMEMKKETDISLEKYPLYDSFLQQTLETPDEIYLNNEYDEEISVYIKACEQKGVSFFYIALCKVISSEQDEDILIPILTFPSIDGDIHKHFKKGTLTQGTLLN